MSERDTKLSDEVGRFWGEIAATYLYSGQLRQPVFDRVDQLASEFSDRDLGELKEDMLQVVSEYLAVRRDVITRVF